MTNFSLKILIYENIPSTGELSSAAFSPLSRENIRRNTDVTDPAWLNLPLTLSASVLWLAVERTLSVLCLLPTMLPRLEAATDTLLPGSCTWIRVKATCYNPHYYTYFYRLHNQKLHSHTRLAIINRAKRKETPIMVVTPTTLSRWVTCEVC